MLLGVIFWTEAENFDRIKNYLKKTYRLVPPVSYISGKLEQEIIKNYLVYEDSNLVSGKLKGVYRINFHYTHPDGSYIGFAYYGRRLNDKIRQDDPMKQAIIGAYSLLKPVRVTDWAIRPIDLESLLNI